MEKPKTVQSAELHNLMHKRVVHVFLFLLTVCLVVCINVYMCLCRFALGNVKNFCLSCVCVNMCVPVSCICQVQLKIECNLQRELEAKTRS